MLQIKVVDPNKSKKKNSTPGKGIRKNEKEEEEEEDMKSETNSYGETEWVSRVLTGLTRIREISSSNLSRVQSLLAEVFHGFSHSLQVNAETVS
jgi:hypothetical protein